MTRFGTRFVILLLPLIIRACSPAPPTPTPTLPPSPTASATPSAIPTPTPTFSQPPTMTPQPVDTGWRTLTSGVQWRRIWTDTGAGRELLRLVRLDPQLIRPRVVYQPAHPRNVSQWAAILPGALVVINAGYFTPDNRAAGLIISDGIPWGRSYGDYAGMLAVSTNGQVTLRWLRTWPFNPNEKLAQAVQSFPVLIKPGGVMGFPSDADQGQRSRRTVVAQDSAGRIILIVSPEFRFSLHELATWLTESDLELDIAINLDGGTSTGLWIDGHDDLIDSQVPVPAVIAFEPVG